MYKRQDLRRTVLGALRAGNQLTRTVLGCLDAIDKLRRSVVELVRTRHRRGRAVVHLRGAGRHLRGAGYKRGHVGVHLVGAGVELQHGGAQRRSVVDQRRYGSQKGVRSRPHLRYARFYARNARFELAGTFVDARVDLRKAAVQLRSGVFEPRIDSLSLGEVGRGVGWIGRRGICLLYTSRCV